jgi:hypothetical protein
MQSPEAAADDAEVSVFRITYLEALRLAAIISGRSVNYSNPAMTLTIQSSRRPGFAFKSGLCGRFDLETASASAIMYTGMKRERPADQFCTLDKSPSNTFKEKVT